MPLSERSQALRATRVGASEVGAIMGIDPYRGPLTVWSRLVHGAQPEQSKRMAIGAALERPIAELWARTNGHRIRLNNRTRTRGNLAATVDGFVLDRGGALEIKWSGGGGYWVGGELPEPIRWQAIAQSAVYGQQARRVTVVALVDADLREWVVEPTRAERRAVRQEVDLFMARHVDTGEIPVPMFPAELIAYLRLTQGTDPDARRPATDMEQATATYLAAAREQVQMARQLEDAYRAELLAYIANDPRPRVVGDGWTYTNDGERIVISTRKDA